MQEREPCNAVILPVKRSRTPTGCLKSKPCSLNQPLKINSEITQREILQKSTFHAHLSQSGEAKAFWYFPSLEQVVKSTENLVFSEWFLTGDKERWRLLLWPYKKTAHSGVYVELELDGGRVFYRRPGYIRFRVLVDKGKGFEPIADSSLSENFTMARVDWGFDDLVDHEKIKGHRPILIETTVVSMSSHEESKYITDYVGLINEGTTCYVNSLLQTLFFLTTFRNAVYQMPTHLEDSDKLPLSLQLVFYHLQCADTPASTKDLLNSFGWDAEQLNIQHDIQEFNCILAETLEKKMKNTAAEGTYSKMFTGKMKNLVVCNDVEFQSTRVESFTELQLNVKGCKDVYESLEKYVESEELNGDNQYEAGEFGKQNARKEVVFAVLPPVLQLHLKRFEYDPLADGMEKVNDRYEYYEEINLAKYLENHEDSKYFLFSVLVHTGTARGGHYFAYISPKVDGNWYKFNDDSVDNALVSQVFHSNFGGEIVEIESGRSEIFTQKTLKSDRCAYMLVYLHSDLLPIMKENKVIVPQQIHTIFEAEKQKKVKEAEEKAEKDSQITINLLSRDMILDWNRPGITPPDSPLYPVLSFSQSFSKFQLEIPKSFKGKDLRILLSHHIIGTFRLWTFTPGYSNWEFKELKINDSIEKELKNKALFIDVEPDQTVFTKENNEWKFENTLNVSDLNTEIEMVDECFELQTPSHAKVILVYKWYDWNYGNPKLSLFKVVTLTSTANMSQIRNDLCAHWQGSIENLPKMVLHLEKCKVTDLKNKELIAHLHTYKLEDNYELTISKRGSFGVRHVILDNGDAFIGEVPPDILPENYMDAKKYITSICDEVQVKCTYYNKFQTFGYQSFSDLLSGNNENMKSFILATRFSCSQTQFIQQICEIWKGVHVDQVQLYIMKNNQVSPVVVPSAEEENKQKKGISSVASVLGENTEIFFDVLPFTNQVLTTRNLVQIWYLDEDFSKLQQYYLTVRLNGSVKDLDCEVKIIFPSKEFEYFLFSHPQFAIVKELRPSQSIAMYTTNPCYVLGMRVANSTENLLKVFYK